MADNVNIEQKTESDAVQNAIEQIVAVMPDEIVLVDQAGEPFEDDSEEDVIVLDETTKQNLALLMLATGDDFETTVNRTLQHAVEATLEEEEE